MRRDLPHGRLSIELDVLNVAANSRRLGITIHDKSEA